MRHRDDLCLTQHMTQTSDNSEPTQADGISRMLDRQYDQDVARKLACPTCDARPNQNCEDRWGQPTSSLHRSRWEADGRDAADNLYLMG